MRGTLLVLGLIVLSAGVASAREAAIGASFQEGMTLESTGVHRLNLGGAMGFGRVGVDAGLQLEIWDPYKKGDVGVKLQGLGANLGVRINLLDKPHFTGPHVNLGGAYLRVRQDYSEKRVNEQFGVADIGPSAFSLRVGAGYGFRTTKDVSIAVRLDVNVWFIDYDLPPEADDSYPNPISIHLVLEMMRFM